MSRDFDLGVPLPAEGALVGVGINGADVLGTLDDVGLGKVSGAGDPG